MTRSFRKLISKTRWSLVKMIVRSSPFAPPRCNAPSAAASSGTASSAAARGAAGAAASSAAAGATPAAPALTSSTSSSPAKASSSLTSSPAANGSAAAAAAAAAGAATTTCLISSRTCINSFPRRFLPFFRRPSPQYASGPASIKGLVPVSFNCCKSPGFCWNLARRPSSITCSLTRVQSSRGL